MQKEFISSFVIWSELDHLHRALLHMLKIKLASSILLLHLESQYRRNITYEKWYFMNITWCITILDLELWDVHTAVQMFYSVAKNKDDYIVNVLLPKWILAKIHLHKYIFLNNSLWYSMSLIMQCSLTQGRIYRDSTFSYEPRSIFPCWDEANNLKLLWTSINYTFSTGLIGFWLCVCLLACG